MSRGKEKNVRWTLYRPPWFSVISDGLLTCFRRESCSPMLCPKGLEQRRSTSHVDQNMSRPSLWRVPWHATTHTQVHTNTHAHTQRETHTTITMLFLPHPQIELPTLGKQTWLLVKLMDVVSSGFWWEPDPDSCQRSFLISLLILSSVQSCSAAGVPGVLVSEQTE